MKKILLSLLSIGAVAVVAVAATGAFFSDTETSTGNTFIAGELDLQVDNTCHYWTDANADGEYVDVGCAWDGQGNPVQEATWDLTDLQNGVHKFFNFNDIKPGDFGEDTVSLHVDNDAWLRLEIDNLVDDDVSCTEPEGVEEGAGCDGTGDGTGELQQNLLFTMWLDQGVTPGFEGPQDLSECDNDYQPTFEPEIISEGPIDPDGETWDLANFPGYPYLLAGDTACFGIAWTLPSGVGNEVQTDSFVGDMTFLVQQHRNNPTPVWP